MAEVGVWHAVTTTTMARQLPPGGVIYGVDSFLKGRLGVCFQELIATQETRPFSNKVRLLKMDSESAAQFLERNVGANFDFVFLDGDHSYEGLKVDWLAWSALLRESGFIAIHDSRSSTDRDLSNAGSAVFTRDAILKDKNFRPVEAIDTLTVLQKISSLSRNHA